MAGSGYKLYLTGDVLSATDVNNYLQQQTVMVFATSAARTSALSLVLAEGMVSYLQDTNAVQVYNGTAWVSVGGSSPLTTKGDLYGFSTLDARVPIGTNNQVLTADSAEALGLKWATPATLSSGLTFITTNSFATSAAVNVDSCFTSTYQNYRLIVNITAAASNPSVLMRLRASGTTDAGNNYATAYFEVNTSAGSGAGGASPTTYISAMNASSAATGFTVDLLNPQATLNTKANSQGFTDESGTLKMRIMSNYTSVTTAYDGFALVASAGTISGNYWVYGYQKA